MGEEINTLNEWSKTEMRLAGNPMLILHKTIHPLSINKKSVLIITNKNKLNN